MTYILQFKYVDQIWILINNGTLVVLATTLSIAMTPDNISKELKRVFEQAQQLKKATERTSTSFSRVPSVTVSSLNTYSKWNLTGIISLICVYFRFSWMS